MRTHQRWLTTFAVMFALLVSVSALPARAEAQATTPAEAEKAEFDLTVYVWGAGIQGDVGIGDLATTGVDASFYDILSNLHMAAMGAFSVRKGNWGTIIDAIYLDLHDTVPTSDPATFGDVDAAMGTQLYSGLITYRIYNAHKTMIDFGWGARYYRIDTDLELTSGTYAGRTAKATIDWWDWLAGVRVVGHPSKRWSLLFYADIGGGGSQLTWEGIAGADFAFNKAVSLAFGYRYLAFNYDETPVRLDLSLPGPYVGLGFHW